MYYLLKPVKLIKNLFVDHVQLYKNSQRWLLQYLTAFLHFLGSTQELVALSGAHTLGSKGFGNPISFDNAYFKILLEKPWSSSGD